MPIRFRCAYCNQLMGISRRKAGTVVRCPSCSGQVVVPNPSAEPTVDHPRLIAIRRDSEGWVFRADEVDQVHRVPVGELMTVPPTLSRSSARQKASTM